MVSGAAAAEPENWRLGRPDLLQLLTDAGRLPDAVESMTNSELLKLSQRLRLASRLTLTHLPQQVGLVACCTHTYTHALHMHTQIPGFHAASFLARSSLVLIESPVSRLQQMAAGHHAHRSLMKICL